MSLERAARRRIIKGELLKVEIRGVNKSVEVASARVHAILAAA
jgi:hypothetical protein